MGQVIVHEPFAHVGPVKLESDLACLVASDSFLAYVAALGHSSYQGFFLCRPICSSRMVFDHSDQVFCSSSLPLVNHLDLLGLLSSDS